LQLNRGICSGRNNENEIAVDRHREDRIAVIVCVFTNEVDAARRTNNDLRSIPRETGTKQFVETLIACPVR
jgi:hypothetical protein